VLKATAANRPLEMETASRRQIAATQRLGCGVRLGARRFSQRAQLTQRQSETCIALDWPDTGRAWWAADGAWSACGRVERADIPLLCKGGHYLLSNDTHSHTHTPRKERKRTCLFSFFALRVPGLEVKGKKRRIIIGSLWTSSRVIALANPVTALFNK
jgi:hypothetical protein